MKAIIPLSIAALRVSNPDSTNVTGGPGFAGRTAAFDLLPHGSQANRAATGDTIWLPLTSGTPSVPLEAGVHLHWELPEYFKRGIQDPATGMLTFPPVPTRWLVVRSLSSYDAAARGYGAPDQASWIVESDYLTPTLGPDSHGIVRPAATVPLTAPDGVTPFMYMGRVIDAASWDPASENPQDYLPHYTGPGGSPRYLTSVGFAGATFASYYPDCRSVFGFWDTFADLPDVRMAITQNDPVRFVVSYQVIGWLPDAATDPLAALATLVTTEYNQYAASCAREHVKIASKPADVFARITTDRFGWQFSENAISYTLAPDGTLATLTVPDATLCAGVVQQIVWDQLDPSSGTPFLAPPDGAETWSGQVEAALGDTTVDAVSALVRGHLAAPGGTEALASYETLLNALQLGLLRDLEAQGNSLVSLEQALHTRTFSAVDGGRQWTIQTTAAPDSQASVALTLPLPLAGQLAALNTAQRAYDQARRRVEAARQQLFMDWVILVKQLARGPSGADVVATNALSSFIATASSGELHAVTGAGAAAGLLSYPSDPVSGRVTGVSATDAADTLAGQVASAYQTVAAALAALPDEWELDAVPAAPFWMPTDPVLVLAGDQLGPVRRNGLDTTIAVRADTELISVLELAATAGHWTVDASALAGLPASPAALPASAAAAALIGEAALLDPQYATVVAAATSAAGQAALAASLAAAQGGQSPLDPPVTAGLYGAVRAAGYQRQAAPSQTVQAPGQLTVTFTNEAGTALAPDAVGWTAQAALPAFAPTRVDPFLPVWLTWQVSLEPLARGTGGNYDTGTLAQKFLLDADQTGLIYPVPGPANFTTGQLVRYSGAVVLSKKPFTSLTQQIDRYLAEFPDDAADPDLTKARADLAGRTVMSQALDTFSLAQTLRTTIPQIPLIGTDPITRTIRTSVTATPGDSWYDTGFNALTAISTGLQSQDNYGPLRSGFLDLRQLAVVDVFGQILNLTTAATTPTGALQAVLSQNLSPAAGDTANAGRAYLPPRVLAPSRVDAHWLSASHNQDVPGVTGDLVEVNDHPATSPVCGWIVPNHLDVSLAFYDADGSPIGSFGIEHGSSRYRTTPANARNNPQDNLEQDIARVNGNLARLMRFTGSQPAGFLTDLMATIEQSDQFINPASFAQDVALSVLVGRPLAVVRMTQSISTAGAVLPASQANNTTADALSQAVTNGWYDYAERQAHTCAALDQVLIPVRLGDLTDIDDGLVAFLPEASGQAPYTVVYSAAAPAGGSHGVVRPGPDTVQLTLNGAPRIFTAIVDPRAPVHVTTGVLPTATMRIPPDQYLRAAQRLAVTFTSRPLLSGQAGPRFPLPDVAGFGWSWVSPDAAPAPLTAQASTDAPSYGYSPQTLLEGWLGLTPNPNTTPSDTAQNGG